MASSSDGWKERLRQAVEASPLKQREIATKAGFKSATYVATLMSPTGPKNLKLEQARALAPVLKVSDEWLYSGEASGERPPAPAVPEAIDRWVADTLQEVGERRYTYEQIMAAKALLVHLRLELGAASPKPVVLGALEAAHEVEASKRPMTVNELALWLVRRCAPEPKRPRSGSHGPAVTVANGAHRQ